MILAVGGTFGITAYLDLPRPPVLIIVPNGFRGPIKLVIDPKSGDHIPLVDGQYTVRIPKSGLLIIKSADPVTQWHSERAMFANGDSLPRDYDRTFPPETIRMYFLGSRFFRDGDFIQESIDYFVGNEFDFRLYQKTAPDF
jgi:hypothetical protein